jgi:hypothetical protein
MDGSVGIARAGLVPLLLMRPWTLADHSDRDLSAFATERRIAATKARSGTAVPWLTQMIPQRGPEGDALRARVLRNGLRSALAPGHVDSRPGSGAPDRGAAPRLSETNSHETSVATGYPLISEFGDAVPSVRTAAGLSGSIRFHLAVASERARARQVPYD